MEENYINKEIDQVIVHLKDFMALEGLKKNFSQENFLAKEAFEVEISHQYLNEINRFVMEGYQLNIPSLIDFDPLFLALEKGSVLSAVELYNVADLLIGASDLIDTLEDKKDFEHLNDDALDLDPVAGLKRQLLTDLEPDYTVSDNASAKLKEIRVKKRGLERSLSSIIQTYKNRYSAYLISNTINMKNGEETLPVKTQYKNLVKGSIVAYSQTGETAFMVPYEMLEVRSRLREALEEENSEVMNILADLSTRCSKQLKALKRDYEIIMNFDRYYASFRYGGSYNGSIAEQSKEYLSLNSLFHPLLQTTKIITNSLALGKDNPKTLLITGPNAGGKSVLIKAVALAVKMDKLGLMVPCHEVSYVPFIDEVYFLGGDNQSVLDNLSTFSSHLVGIKHITENSTSKSLVIIDEVGEGTSPKDGEALAVALLKFFENRTCYTILTSHFDGLKFYAAKDDKAMTGAMEFNNDSLKPTYRLLLHTTGKSYGLQLAKSIGLDPSIIKDAMEFEKSQANQDVNSLMEKLTVQESENSKLQRELINKKKDLERAIEKRELAIRSLNEEKSSIHQKAQEKVERLVDQRLKDMDAIWKNKQASESYGEFSKAKGELNKIKTDTSNLLVINEKAKVLIDLKVGDLVDDEDSRRATVIEIKKNEVILDLDGLRFRRPIAGLKRGHLRASDIKKKEKKNDDIVSIDLAPSKGLELNIIGQRVDEAMRNVVSFIDGAKIRKLGYIRIVHGMGSFALKNAVWKYLQNHPGLVKDYRLGVQGEGGMGATIIHL